MGIRFSSLFVITLVAVTGCVKTATYRVALLNPNQQNVSAPAPQIAVYNIQVANDKGKWSTVPGTERLVDRGQPMGFERGERGIIYASVGDEKFEVDAPKAKGL